MKFYALLLCVVFAIGIPQILAQSRRYDWYHPSESTQAVRCNHQIGVPDSIFSPVNWIFRLVLALLSPLFLIIRIVTCPIRIVLHSVKSILNFFFPWIGILCKTVSSLLRLIF